MNRREVLTGVAGAAALMTAADGVFAADDHNHMEHMNMDMGHMDHEHMGHTPYGKLIETTTDCIRTGEICITHCFGLFAAGDTSVAACAKSVYQMDAVCQALMRLAAAGSQHVAELAKLAQIACMECEKECRKHENHHAECKLVRRAVLLARKNARKFRPETTVI